MGVHTKCLDCHGRKTDWHGRQCRRCGGSGHQKPYRRNPVLGDEAWMKLESTLRLGDPARCSVCSGALPGRKRTFCSEDCRRGYFWRVYRGAHWTKRTIVIRDGAVCRACGEVKESPIRDGGPPYPLFSELQLDHIKALHRGGDDHPDNMQLLCEPCHKKKTASERKAKSKESPR